MTDQDQDTSTSQAEADVTDEQLFNEMAAAEKTDTPLSSLGGASEDETSDNSFDEAEQGLADDQPQGKPTKNWKHDGTAKRVLSPAFKRRSTT